jgi:hypothetical protein
MKSEFKSSIVYSVGLTVLVLLFGALTVFYQNDNAIKTEYLELIPAQVAISPFEYKHTIEVALVYPAVIHKPGTLMYTFSILKEEIYSFLGYASNLFYAKKRVAEISEFDPILTSEPQDEYNYEQVKNQSFIGKYFHTNSVNYLLGSYAKHIFKSYESTTNIQEAISVLNELRRDQLYILENTKEKEYSDVYNEFFENLKLELFGQLSNLYNSGYVYPLEQAKIYSDLSNFDIDLSYSEMATSSIYVVTTDSFKTFEIDGFSRLPDDAVYLVVTIEESDLTSAKNIVLTNYNEELSYTIENKILFSLLGVNEFNYSQKVALLTSFKPYSYPIKITEKLYFIIPSILFIIPVIILLWILVLYRKYLLDFTFKKYEYFKKYTYLILASTPFIVYYLFGIKIAIISFLLVLAVMYKTIAIRYYVFYFGALIISLVAFSISYLLEFKFLAEMFMQIFTSLLVFVLLIFLLRPSVSGLDTANKD